MATYCYRCPSCDTQFEVTVCARWKRCVNCGKRAVRYIAGEHAPRRRAGARWPILSDALSVHPKQVKGMRKRVLEAGVPTEIRPDGRPVLRDAKHRKRFCEAFGYYDRNAGYGDPLPK